MANPELEAIIKEISNNGSINLIVPANLTKPDPLVVALKNHLKSKDHRTSYERKGIISTRSGYFNTSIKLENLNRALPIIDTFVKALKGRKHQLLIGDKTFVKINDEKVEIRFWEKCRSERKKEKSWDTRELIPTGHLFIQLIDMWVIKEWGDTPYTLLENKLGRIIGAIEYFAKKEAEENIRREIMRKKYEEEERVRKEIKQKKDDEQKRFSELLQESKRWAEAQQLRAYLSFIESNCSSKENLSTWIEWARAKADWYDPLIKNEDKWMDGFS
ncbi:hypothetical protein SAMN04488057_11298 [Cyclobacterium lianum]|uniref:Uncharacterized protein n=1 Tax=Cyclobacterium lianum TaxID=388280 RepID=A0A1M7PZV4_9BACT|nr:hypothetical protein [Cyclobacterium lianum]SHN23332.1 hypothetical protein SAMN04488057_11298 [Cyclobacterium lianum]